jgi:hypothetical protein
MGRLARVAAGLSLSDPGSIDDSSIPPDEIRLLKETVATHVDPGTVRDHFLGSIAWVRRVRERHSANQGDPGSPATGEQFNDHDDREDGQRPESGPATDPALDIAKPEGGADPVPEI